MAYYFCSNKCTLFNLLHIHTFVHIKLWSIFIFGRKCKRKVKLQHKKENGLILLNYSNICLLERWQIYTYMLVYHGNKITLQFLFYVFNFCKFVKKIFFAFSCSVNSTARYVIFRHNSWKKNSNRKRTNKWLLWRRFMKVSFTMNSRNCNYILYLFFFRTWF